jgi:glucan phosphorylase
LLRATKEVSKKGNAEAVKFHRQVKRIVDHAKKLKNTKQSPSSIAEEKAKLMERITELATQNYSDPDCARLAKRLGKYKDQLFTFLDFLNLEYHNNSAERGLRSSVVIRKISGGNRSSKGANAHQIIMSIQETAKLAGKSFINTCKDVIVKSLNTIRS